MKTSRAPFALLLFPLLALLEPTRSAAEPEAALYVDPTPFGPQNVAFPWFSSFSADGKWIGFSDGYSPYVEIWDAEKNVRAWPTEGKSRRGTHRVAFASDSKAMAYVDGERLSIVRLVDGAWRENAKESITLLEKPPISLRDSPLRLSFMPSGKGVVLSTGEAAVTIDLTCSCIEDLTDAKDVRSTFAFPDGSTAIGRSTSFVTHVIPRRDPELDVPGVLLESDPTGTTWLLASDKARFDVNPTDGDAEAHLALEIREARSAKPTASFELSRKRSAPALVHRLLNEAQFSADARLLATVEGSGSIVLRDTATAAPIQTIHEYEKGQPQGPYAMGVAFSPDGERLITGGRRQVGPQCLLWKRTRR